MEGWPQDLLKTLEAVTEGIEQFFEEVGKDMNDAAVALLEFTEEMAEEIERAIVPLEEAVPGLDQLDEQIADWFEPIWRAVMGLEATLDRAAEPFTHTIEPLINQHTACVGCRHYHGQTYNGTVLVCAMHPYGIVDGSDQCPDKQPIAWALPPANPLDSSTDDDI